MTTEENIDIEHFENEKKRDKKKKDKSSKRRSTEKVRKSKKRLNSSSDREEDDQHEEEHLGGAPAKIRRVTLSTDSKREEASNESKSPVKTKSVSSEKDFENKLEKKNSKVISAKIKINSETKRVDKSKAITFSSPHVEKLKKALFLTKTELLYIEMQNKSLTSQHLIEDLKKKWARY